MLNNLEGLTAADPVSLRIVFDGDGSDEEVQQLATRFAQVASVALRGDEVSSRENSSENKENSEQNQASNLNKNPFPGLAVFRKHQWFRFRMTQRNLSSLMLYPAADSRETPLADVGVHFSKISSEDFDDPSGASNASSFEATIIQSDNGFARTAADYLRYCFRKANDFELQLRLQQAGLPTKETWVVKQDVIGESSGSGLASLASLIPLVLVLMTITGAVYPAIDLTAGERERERWRP